MIAGSPGEQPHIPPGVAAHWGAIGAMAAQARGTTDPKDIKIRELTEQIRTLTDKVGLAEGRLKTAETKLDQANATVDDQAAQIVDLQGKIGLGGSNASLYTDAIRKLQAIDMVQRKNIDRAEARASQLVGYMREHQIEVPAEAAYFCRDGTNPSF